MLLKRLTGNRERKSGNECTAVTRLRIQHGGRKEVNNDIKGKLLIDPRLQCN